MESNGGGRHPSAYKMESNCGGCLSGAIVPYREHGGRMQYAPTRTSDNGRRRSFAPVGIHFIGHRVPSAGRVGAYCIRPFKWPRRGQIRRRRPTPIRLRNGFRRRRIPDRRYCFLPGTWGAYAIRPYTDVRQWPLSFICPQNGFQYVRPTPIRLRWEPFYGPMTPIRL